ncbi:DUF5342 family protein [Viridibacillus arvi]|uniref:Uncharacterized protein n=1 Tax=Viridibacillus arvi TaxID=263475 RepID=A0A0M0LGV3_9BACL|nr:DUF5342 family protein [Viridibacillus arvi]KOO49933.1 hypothetical protein AMD00_16635 [Viridibacillus arvi]
MLQNFEVIKPLCEGQVNERFQFKINIEGNDYRGIFHDREVQWFHPQPHSKIEKDEFNFVEAKVHNLMIYGLLH